MPINTQAMDYAGSSAPLLSEILTKVNNAKMKDDKIKVLRDNAAWFDTGSADAMFEASMFVKSIQSRTGQMIGCIEEVAWKKQLIDEIQFHYINLNTILLNQILILNLQKKLAPLFFLPFSYFF